jgi:hypothetical protein
VAAEEAQECPDADRRAIARVEGAVNGTEQQLHDSPPPIGMIDELVEHKASTGDTLYSRQLLTAQKKIANEAAHDVVGD